MPSRDVAFLRHQRARWLRPDAHRWVRADAARFLERDTDLGNAFPALGQKYNASQPRVPAGNSDGGQSGLQTDSGYQDHHIVNQHTGNRVLFGDAAIDSLGNQARIPVLKHIEISRWYATGNPDYGGLSPRTYLRDKSWDEQMQVGLDIMRKNGVLK